MKMTLPKLQHVTTYRTSIPMQLTDQAQFHPSYPLVTEVGLRHDKLGAIGSASLSTQTAGNES